MKTERQNVLIVAAVLAGLTLFLFVGPGRAWRFFASEPKPVAHLAPSGTNTSSTPTARPTEEDLERALIRDIETVSFLDLFELLHAAPPEMRMAWARHLEGLPPGPQRSGALVSFYKTFVQLDPRAAAESAVSLQDRYARFLAVDAMIAAAPQSAMGEMAKMLTALPQDHLYPRGRRDYWGDAFSDWSSVDPVAVANYFDEQPPISENRLHGLASTLLRNWAALDPDAAKEWLERQPESRQTEAEIEGLLDGWFGRDEPAALAFAVALDREEKFGQTVKQLASWVFLRSPEEAHSFLLRLRDETRTAALHEIAMNVGIDSGRSSPENRSAPFVANWMLTLPKESWRGAMGKVLDDWETKELPGLSAWMDQLPTDTRDHVIAEYCMRMQNLENAIPLALTISDAALRDKSLRYYLSSWLPASRDKVVKTINKAALSEAQKKYLLNLLPLE